MAAEALNGASHTAFDTRAQDVDAKTSGMRAMPVGLGFGMRKGFILVLLAAFIATALGFAARCRVAIQILSVT
jgi:hypothetical protein